MGENIPAPPGAPVQWMQRPAPLPNCPVGLEYLTMIDKLEAQQLKSLTEILTGWERNNKYAIRNGAGQQCYFAEETTGCCMRQCCGKSRGFEIFIKDNTGMEVIKVSREFKCCAGCCWCAGCLNCCAYLVKIESPQSGEILGYIKQGGSLWKANYKVMDENMATVLEIDGPCCICDGPCCPCDNEFKLMTLDGTSQVGGIKKIYAGLLTEMFTDSDKFQIDFPMDLSVKVKASLLGALFLIDFMFFEKEDNN